MTLPDSAFDFSLKAVHWLNPIVYMVGAAIGTWAYRRSRKIGYVVVAAYFVLMLVTVSILPVVNSMIESHWDTERSAELSPQAHRQFVNEYTALLQKYYPPGQQSPATIHLNLPIGPIILVAGVWLLARRDSGRTTGHDSPASGRQSVGAE
jgi:hypothetical protein